MFELDNFVYALHMDNCLNGDFFFLFFAGITLLLGVGFVICGILVLLFFRGFVDDYIKSEIPLRENTPIAEAWAKPPITPYLKLYFFNVTNPQRFLKGAKPVLQEIGPFTYQ